MTKKKQVKKEDTYTLEEVQKAEETMGDLMSQCEDEIFEVISKYPFTPAIVWGICESIKLTISNDINEYMTRTPPICNDCKDELQKQEKSSPKKVKEAQAAMYG